MQANTAKAKLRSGSCVYGTSLEDCLSPEMPYLLKAAGLDLFFVDTEHSPAAHSDIEHLARTGRTAGVTPLVRVTDNVPHLITRALDVGAMGIVVPRVGSAQEACNAVASMKYIPEGRRGFGMRSVITDFQWTNAVDEMASANRETMAVLQIESVAGLESVEQIAAVPNVDVLFVGPYDLTISMGIAEQFESAAFWSSIDRVIAACRASGIAAGIQSSRMDILKEAKQRGMRFLLYASDIAVLLRGFRAGISELSAS